eukprot:COSAG04_NODE_2957_length_3348_cov_3.757772_6_plen_66_part_00
MVTRAKARSAAAVLAFLLATEQLRFREAPHGKTRVKAVRALDPGRVRALLSPLVRAAGGVCVVGW